MKIKFCGAAKTVTGSCYLIETRERKFLVDCGMFQGSVHDLNTSPFPFNPAEIDFMILTHAHIDHSGRIPILVKNGFKGSIYCTSATAELAQVMLKDSAHIQETEAQQKTKKRLRKGLEPVEPLYTIVDAELAGKYIYPVSYDKTEIIDENISFTLKDAGHLLGSAIVQIQINEDGQKKIITFTGDLGNFNIPIIKDYEYIEKTDYLIMESTYGNRLHEIDNQANDLYEIIVNTVKRGGNVILPAFAVGRAQELLYLLNYYIDIEKRKKIKNVEVYLDSPLAKSATEIFGRHMECYDDEAVKLFLKDTHPLDFSNLKIIESPEESQELNKKNGVVIISSSGMCEAGRIKHHLKHNIWREDCSLVFVGYQAEGTLGRKILDGAEKIKIFGEEMVVKAKIYRIESLSGHADLNGILNWVKNIRHGVSKQIFITHGEEEAAENLKKEIEKLTAAEVIIPNMNEEYKI
ncbi:metallo-beta-lactamase [Fervidicella metallireducens AeB]|uniref:Metallo-beta-lactamase n=1 Tax=Fervidicella metallireducens AeB TaxID=1403537 RepID=A0A017RX34_9CLOT|nr:MBL fold metallo-hydrolase [Fervidicella metallireducens]EYE89126.1 metallo-beta-lactamase [Fervidicella metallireducens AeB]